MLPTDLVQKLLLIGIFLIVAALIGGGLEAANLIKLPILSDRRTRAAVGILGAILMSFAYVSIQTSQRAATNAEARAEFGKKYDQLLMGAAAIPTPPAWSDQAIADKLEDLAVSAGADVGMNCELTNFMRVHKLPYVDWPTTLQERFVSASQSPAAGFLVCYQKAIAAEVSIAEAASQQAPRPCRPARAKSVTGASVQSYAPVRVVSFADYVDVDPPIGGVELAQASEVAPATAGTSILEAIATVGQSGWMYVGQYTSGGRLGNDRTVIEIAPSVNATVTIREPVNLRAVGTDANYRAHKIVAVIPPGSQVTIKSLTPPSQLYGWASIVIKRIPSRANAKASATVYIQYSVNGVSQRDKPTFAKRAQAFADGLLATGNYAVPPIEAVSTPLAQTIVRYFHTQDADLANALARFVKNKLGGKITTQYFTSSAQVPVGQLEVWIAKS
jgi:hypothetical protein